MKKKITEDSIRKFCEKLVALGYAKKTGKVWDGKKVDDVFHFTKEDIKKYAKTIGL